MGFETYKKDRPGQVVAAHQCKYCGSTEVCKAGKRKLKSGGVKQLFQCRACGRRYSNTNRAERRTDPAAILETLKLYCQGYTYDEIGHILRRKYKVAVTRGALCKWVKAYDPPYLAIRDMNRRYRRVVLSWLFTHSQLNYDYRIHLPKLTFCNKRFPALKSYLMNLPDFIDHDRFAEGSRCSQMNLVENTGVRKERFNGLNQVVLNALLFAKTNYQRHHVVEDFLLSCDRDTIAAEVPVYYYDKKHGGIHGHIDLLQVRHGRLYVLDYKPNAHKENPAKVMTQLSLYATALHYRGKVDYRDMRCAWFDEEHWFEFDPGSA